MDEKMKTTLLAALCVLIIVASFVGMQYVRSLYNQQTIELGDISFKAPNGYKYVNGSFEEVTNDSDNGTTFYKIILQNEDKTIEFRQYNSTLQLSGDTADLNGISVYKISTGSLDQYSFNFNGKGYGIIHSESDQLLIEEIVNSMKVNQ